MTTIVVTNRTLLLSLVSMVMLVLPRLKMTMATVKRLQRLQWRLEASAQSPNNRNNLPTQGLLLTKCAEHALPPRQWPCRQFYLPLELRSINSCLHCRLRRPRRFCHGHQPGALLLHRRPHRHPRLRPQPLLPSLLLLLRAPPLSGMRCWSSSRSCDTKPRKRRCFNSTWQRPTKQSKRNTNNNSEAATVTAAAAAATVVWQD